MRQEKEEKFELFDKERRELLGPDVGQSYLYVIEGGGMRKLGMSKSPKERLCALQPSSPLKLRIERTMRVSAMFARTTENHAHKVLGEFRRHGEWFECSKQEAITALREAAKLNAKLVAEHDKKTRPALNDLYEKYFARGIADCIKRSAAEECRHLRQSEWKEIRRLESIPASS